METLKTKGFTAKDRFNTASATPIKEAKGTIIKVKDVMVTENTEGEAVGFLKTSEDDIYATISVTVIDQLVPLIDILQEDGEQEIAIITKTSEAGNEYFMLELQ